ncbi:hypothetical protein ACFCY8_31275, partial [Streptomyces noursei]|uniref:hypothetical protein n=1 Tax=Streptomyces noursei TaxID=1971 RepID=UPI0035DC89C0
MTALWTRGQQTGPLPSTSRPDDAHSIPAFVNVLPQVYTNLDLRTTDTGEVERQTPTKRRSAGAPLA